LALRCRRPAPQNVCIAERRGTTPRLKLKALLDQVSAVHIFFAILDRDVVTPILHEVRKVRGFLLNCSSAQDIFLKPFQNFINILQNPN